MLSIDKCKTISKHNFAFLFTKFVKLYGKQKFDLREGNRNVIFTIQSASSIWRYRSTAVLRMSREFSVWYAEQTIEHRYSEEVIHHIFLWPFSFCTKIQATHIGGNGVQYCHIATVVGWENLAPPCFYVPDLLRHEFVSGTKK